MRAKLILISLMICYIISPAAIAQIRRVSQAEALTIAQQQFQGKDVDYFILQDKHPTTWTIFVDAEPMKGWEHECYLLTIPKSIPTSLNAVEPLSSVQRKMPPSGDFTPLSVKNRFGTNANSKPVVTKEVQSNAGLTVAQRTYAIILSGGVNKTANYERYWNDCSFIYQTLVNKYGVPKENIFPIMSDGNNPAEDMRLTTGGFTSQPLDLDNDGVADIKLSATKANIQSVLNSLKVKLKEDDHLLFYVIDHGGSTDNNTNSYICLWGNESLYDYQLANLLTVFTQKNVNVNVVLGQCFAGGFNDNLTKVGCVVSSACTGAESSWACGDIPYDEFVYQWTTAINGANHRGAKVYPDTDKNGRITMDEAFIYAKNHDRRSAEHPQYVSTPLSVGEDLAFNYLAPAVDIYIKDNPEDTGKEPNMTINEFWKSPSICVRNYDDGIFEHQNPEYSSDHQMAFVYVRVYNRGKKDYVGGKFMHVYWAQASTGLTTKAWKGREVYKPENSSKMYVTGGALEPVEIDSITAGDYTTVKLKWALPTSLEDYPEGNFHFCLLGKIMDLPYDDGYKDGVVYFDLRGSNDQAQKNVTIIRKKDVHKGFNVFVRNIQSTQQSYTLELIPQTESDAAIYSSAKVEMAMSPKVYTAWERGGFQYDDLELLSSSSNSNDLRKVRLLSPQSKIKNITLKGDEFDIVSLKFDFNKYSTVSKTYTFDLVQKDEAGNIVGGETFIVESPTLASKPIIIDPTPVTPGNIQLNAISSDFSAYTWKDNVGNNIGTGSSITVSPVADDTKYTVIATNEEGEVAEESISLDAVTGIKCVSSETGYIKVSLRGDASDNSRITISSAVNGTVVASDSFIKGESEITINLPNRDSGVYIVTYLVGDTVIDSQKITIVE